MTHFYRCPGCRTRRMLFTDMQAHVVKTGHKACRCGGYHYAHRPGSPFCVSNPMSDVRIADRQGDCTDEQLLEIAVDCAWRKPGRPFTKWRD